MSGFDWATYKDNPFGVNADLLLGCTSTSPRFRPPMRPLDEIASSRACRARTSTTVLRQRRDRGRHADASGATPAACSTAEGIALINGLQDVLGAGVTSFDGGNIILGGDGSDIITGRGGDDIIDGDKWLNVQIGVYANGPGGIGTGALIKSVDSMTDLVTEIFNGTYNPGQLKIIRSIETANGAGDIDTAAYQGNRAEYTFAGNSDGSVQVTHALPGAFDDGSDKLRNIDRLQFLDGTLGLIVGTSGNDVLNGTATDDLILGLAGNDILNGLEGNDILVGGPNTPVSGTYADSSAHRPTQTTTGLPALTGAGPNWRSHDRECRDRRPDPRQQQFAAIP